MLYGNGSKFQRKKNKVIKEKTRKEKNEWELEQIETHAGSSPQFKSERQSFHSQPLRIGSHGRHLGDVKLHQHSIHSEFRTHPPMTRPILTAARNLCHVVWVDLDSRVAWPLCQLLLVPY